MKGRDIPIEKYHLVQAITRLQVAREMILSASKRGIRDDDSAVDHALGETIRLLMVAEGRLSRKYDEQE